MKCCWRNIWELFLPEVQSLLCYKTRELPRFLSFLLLLFFFKIRDLKLSNPGMIYVNLWQKKRWIFCDSCLEQVQALIFTIIKPAGLIIDLNFDSIAARSWSTFLPKMFRLIRIILRGPRLYAPHSKNGYFFYCFSCARKNRKWIYTWMEKGVK